LIGCENQSYGRAAHDVTELSHTEKSRQRHSNLARHRAAKLSDDPINAVGRENSDRSGLGFDIGGKAAHSAEELTSPNNTLAIANRSFVACLQDVTVQRVK
jgi:hypothetical protein